MIPKMVQRRRDGLATARYRKTMAVGSERIGPLRFRLLLECGHSVERNTDLRMTVCEWCAGR